MSLQIHLFGSPRFVLTGEPLRLSRRKSIALLAYLVVTGQPQSRDALLGLLWPEYESAAARANLRRDLSWLRRMLPDDLLVVDRLQIDINPVAGAWLDVQAFEAGITAVAQHVHQSDELCDECAQRLAEAVDLYEGDFMAGFSLANSAEFEEWYFFQREQYRQKMADSLQQLISWCQERQKFEQGIIYGRRWLALDPWHEPAHRALMALYAYSDQKAAALRQYEECVRLLEEELGIQPEAETEALYEAIRTRRIGKMPTTAPESLLVAADQQTEASASPQANGITSPAQPKLPMALTPLIGRQQEKVDLVGLLTSTETRLVTIIGVGGMGKTRLALAVATILQAQDDPPTFPDGVYFAEMGALETAEFILPTIAQALGVRLDHGSQQLVTFLQDKKSLIVLDNFEHLLAGAALMQDLLQQLPLLTILVTSRERLRLQEEQLYPLSGLAIPTVEDPEAAAAALFLSNARRVRPHFAPNLAQQSDIIRICQLVEGMPLALELAGSWLDTLSPQEIGAEIVRNLDFLETELINVPRRHRSVRAAIDGSWQRLSPEQQGQLARLSTLRGSFTREAAAAIGGVSLRTLTHLINKSFVGFQQQTQRYDIHALILQFAASQLAQNPTKKAETEAAHAQYFSELLGSWRWFTPYKQIEPTIDRIEVEIDNVRAMWRWVIAQEDIERVYHGFTTLGRFYLLRGALSEGIGLLEAAAEMVARVEGESVLLGRITAVLSSLYRWQGDYETAISAAQKAIAIGKALDAMDVQALALFEWGHTLVRLSQFEASEEILDEALAATRQAQLTYLEGDVLQAMALVNFYRGENDEAEQKFVTALALFRECQGIQGEAFTLNGLGLIKAVRKQMRQASQLFEQSRALHHQIKDRVGEARALTNLANSEAESGHLVAAITYNKRALTMHRAAGIRLGEAVNLGWLGKIYGDLGQYETARDYLQQGVAICQQINTKPDEINLMLKSCQLALQMGDYQTAYPLAQQGLTLAYEFEVLRQIPVAMNCRGHALQGMGEWAAAQEAYQDALEQLKGEKQTKERTEPQAGLARLALDQGEVTQALAHIEPVLLVIAERPLTGIFGAYDIYLTCYEVLQSAGDERAEAVLATAVSRLEAQAQQIDDDQLRASFLQNVSANRTLLATRPAGN